MENQYNNGYYYNGQSCGPNNYAIARNNQTNLMQVSVVLTTRQERAQLESEQCL